jgi:hypothetical protein
MSRAHGEMTLRGFARCTSMAVLRRFRYLAVRRRGDRAPGARGWPGGRASRTPQRASSTSRWRLCGAARNGSVRRRSREMTDARSCASALSWVCQPHLAQTCHRSAARLPAGVAFGTDPADGSQLHERLVPAETAWLEAAWRRNGLALLLSAQQALRAGKAARDEQYSAGRRPCPRQSARDWSPRARSRCALRRPVW